MNDQPSHSYGSTGTNKHEYVLNGGEPKSLSSKQRNAIYWRAWNAVEQVQHGINRFAITARLLGRVKKIAEMTDEEFRKVVRAFESIAKKKSFLSGAARGSDTEGKAATESDERSGKRSSFQSVPSVFPANGNTDLVRDAGQPPTPPAEISSPELPIECTEAASLRLHILAPLIRRYRYKGIESIIRHASESDRAQLGSPCNRTLRRWINRAIERDRNRGQFERAELYRPTRTRSMENNRPQFDNWPTVYVYERKLISDGMAAKAARRIVCTCIKNSSIGKEKSCAAIRMAFKRNRERVPEAGDKLADRRDGNSGRKPKFQLTQQECDALRHHRLRKGSLPLAVEDFANDPNCLPGTREKILAELNAAAREKRLPRWPMSMQRAGYVSDDVKARFRGDKHFQEFEVIERRGMWMVDEEGRKLPILPNTLFESDDMSWNEPFRYHDPESGIVRVGRQTLCTQDVLSLFFLGASPIGRERDAYRLEDIADHLLDVVDTHGLPLYWRFERGPWENQVIDGIKLGDGTVWGSLGHLFRVIHVFKARGKAAIESSFNFLQRLSAHESLSIGRRRGEFERATKLYLAASRGDERAASYFWEIGQAADAIAAAMARFNRRPKERRAFGRQLVVPADLYRDVKKRECPRSERWRFSPVKRMATVRGGAIQVSVNHYPFAFRFRVNGVTDVAQVYFERGYSVLIAFHPGRPEDGCHVFNAEIGARNRDGLKFGEFLMVAPMSEDAPQINLRPEEYAFATRKNANAAVRSEFRAIVNTGKDASARRISVARDGYGNSIVRDPHGAETRVGARSAQEEKADLSRPAVLIRDAQSQDEKEKAELERLEKLERELIDSGVLGLDAWTRVHR